MKKVSYIEKIDKGYEGILTTQYNTISVDTEFVKTFRLPKNMGKLTTCARLLLDYLTQTMKRNCICYNKAETRQKFLSFSNESYSDVAINKAFKELLQIDALVPIKRGTYAVNPIYYYKGSQAHREKILKKILEFKNGVITFEELIK